MRSTVLEVNLDKFYNNIKNIKKYVGKKELMPVVKANGYGTHINKRLDVLNHFNIVAVAILDEAIEIRKLGYKKEIFVLNPITSDEVEDAIKYDITIGLSNKNLIILINKKLKVHLEIETGMNRTGIKLVDLDNFILEVKKNKNIIVEGIYTHLSSADIDDKYTLRQLYLFRKAVNIVKDNFKNIKYIHSSASNGLINYDDGVSNTVRPGIIMYGYESFKGSNDYINIEPVCKLKTKVSFVKELDKKESIGYCRKYISKKKMKVATIPIGYADGLRRSLFKKGKVLVDGRVVDIVGNICMDSCMIDVTDLDVRVGDTVYIWDNRELTVDDIAKQYKTINYEVISTISDRVPRVFIEE